MTRPPCGSHWLAFDGREDLRRWGCRTCAHAAHEAVWGLDGGKVALPAERILGHRYGKCLGTMGRRFKEAARG